MISVINIKINSKRRSPSAATAPAPKKRMDTTETFDDEDPVIDEMLNQACRMHLPAPVPPRPNAFILNDEMDNYDLPPSPSPTAEGHLTESPRSGSQSSLEDTVKQGCELINSLLLKVDIAAQDIINSGDLDRKQALISTVMASPITSTYSNFLCETKKCMDDSPSPPVPRPLTPTGTIEIPDSFNDNPRPSTSGERSVRTSLFSKPSALAPWSRISFTIVIKEKSPYDGRIGDFFSEVTNDLNITLVKPKDEGVHFITGVRTRLELSKAFKACTNAIIKDRPATEIFEVNKIVTSDYMVKSGRIPAAFFESWHNNNINDVNIQAAVSDLLSKPENLKFFPSASHIKEIELFASSRDGIKDFEYLVVKFHVSKFSFEQFLASEDNLVNICGENHVLYEDFRVEICSRCCEYGHNQWRKPKCENSPKCVYCAGEHLSEKCVNKKQLKCPNCTRENSRIDNGERPPFTIDGSSVFEVNTDHLPRSGICPTLREEKDKLREGAKAKANPEAASRRNKHGRK